MKEIDQIIDGLTTIGKQLPKQAWRTFQTLPPQDQNHLLKSIGLGGSQTMKPYYYDVPQLYRMPAKLGAFKEDSTKKALPFIALGIAAIVGYNILTQSKR